MFSNSTSGTFLHHFIFTVRTWTFGSYKMAFEADENIGWKSVSTPVSLKRLSF